MGHAGLQTAVWGEGRGWETRTGGKGIVRKGREGWKGRGKSEMLGMYVRKGRGERKRKRSEGLEERGKIERLGRKGKRKRREG